jgi:hypothetical protein
LCEMMWTWDSSPADDIGSLRVRAFLHILCASSTAGLLRCSVRKRTAAQGLSRRRKEQRGQSCWLRCSYFVSLLAAARTKVRALLCASEQPLIYYWPAALSQSHWASLQLALSYVSLHPHMPVPQAPAVSQDWLSSGDAWPIPSSSRPPLSSVTETSRRSTSRVPSQAVNCSRPTSSLTVLNGPLQELCGSTVSDHAVHTCQCPAERYQHRYRWGITLIVPILTISRCTALLLSVLPIL